MIILPKSPNAYLPPIWNQVNNSNINGSLYASYNLDLTENEGTLRLGKRLVINTNTTDVAEITNYPAAFRLFNSSMFSIAGLGGTGYVFKTGSDYPSATAFAKVTASNSPSNVDSEYSDMEVSNNNLYVTSKSNNVYYTANGSTWSSSFTAGGTDTSHTHMLTSFQGRTYMTRDGSSILSWDSSNSVASLGSAYTVQLGNTLSNIITFIRSSSNRIWIGTVNTLGGKGYVYEWDGTATQVQKAYRMETFGSMACVIKDDIPYIMDAYGNLLVWNGGTFVKLAGLNRINNKLLYDSISVTNSRFIHPNGMSIVKGKINILIKGSYFDSINSIEDTIPSGIWEYDENKGLYHKHSFGLSKVGDTIIDYGQIKLNGAGAISELNYPDSTAGRNGTFLAGCSYFTNASSTKSGMFFDDSDDTLQKGGYLITQKLQAIDERGNFSIQNQWQNIYTLYRRLLNASDKINIKYRKEEILPLLIDIIWVTTTSFTTGTDLSALTGYEVEIIQGVGSGKTSQIVSTTGPSAGLYTVTVDEIYTGATSTAKARIQNWKKISSIAYSQPTFDQGGIGDLSNWVQFKIWMLFTGKDEIERLIIINENYNPAK